MVLPERFLLTTTSYLFLLPVIEEIRSPSILFPLSFNTSILSLPKETGLLKVIPNVVSDTTLISETSGFARSAETVSLISTSSNLLPQLSLISYPLALVRIPKIELPSGIGLLFSFFSS